MIAALFAAAAAAASPAQYIQAHQRADGGFGGVQVTAWATLGLRAVGAPTGMAAGYLVAHEDELRSATDVELAVAAEAAAAIEALRAAGVGGAAVRRGLAFLRGLEQRDGGFELTRGRGSDTQSTAWAIQAFLAAGARPPAAAYRYLARMQRGDGSLRYSARSGVTPVWVTAQALPALAGKPLPLR